MTLKPKFTDTAVGIAFICLGVLLVPLGMLITEGDAFFYGLASLAVGLIFGVHYYSEYKTNHLYFTPTWFEIKGKRYSYSQIERFVTTTRNRRVRYELHVGGVAVFIFNRNYENAKEFFDTLERNGVSLSPIQ